MAKKSAKKPQKKAQKKHDAQRPAQSQKKQPGVRGKMVPKPESVNESIAGAELLKGKVALVTGGDSGIGRAVAIAFAREGANIAIVYLEEKSDAEDTKRQVEDRGGECLLIKGDIGREAFCKKAVERTAGEFGRLDTLVNNAAEQHPKKKLTDIDEQQLVKTFRTNVFSMFFLSKAALPHLQKRKGTIINTTSVTAYRGSPGLLDYSSTKGAIVAFTRSLSGNLAPAGVRVNAVAPGPIWTPLIPATFPGDKVEDFGGDTPLGRAGQPWECAECYVFLASEKSNYITGQVLHPNGGELIGG